MMVEHFKFNSHVRNANESLSMFVAELRKLTEYCQWCINSFFLQTSTNIEPMKAPPFSKFLPQNALKMHSLSLSVFRFFCKIFSISLHYETFFLMDDFCRVHIFINIICMAINWWMLWSNLSWKDAASSTGRITQSSLNCHLWTQMCSDTVWPVWVPKKICPSNISSTFLRNNFSTFSNFRCNSVPESAFSNDLGLNQNQKFLSPQPLLWVWHWLFTSFNDLE